MTSWRTAGTFNSSGGSGIRFFSRAHASHRCISRLVLLTMSVRWMVAGLEQNWHFMTLPRPDQEGNPPPSPSALLELPDPVAEPGRLLVRLRRHRLLQVLPQPGQLLGADPLGRPAGSLPGVPGRVVNALQQGQQLGLKGLVVVRAAEPAGVAKVHEPGAA